jgi:hypothetical protein
MISTLMLKGLHNFSLVCAIILASGCMGSLIGSLQRSKGGRVPVHQVVTHELPVLMYIWSLVFFVIPLDRPQYVLLMTAICIVTGNAALYRLFSYARKREIFERLELLAGIQQSFDQIHVQVMSDTERAKYLKVQQEPQPTQRRSRYQRELVI